MRELAAARRFDHELRLSHWPVVVMNLHGAARFAAAFAGGMASQPTELQEDQQANAGAEARARCALDAAKPADAAPARLERLLRLVPAVVVLGLAGALEGFGIGLIIPLLGIIMAARDTAGMAGFSAPLAPSRFRMRA